MDLIKIIIICLALSANESLAKIIKAKTSSSDKSTKLVEATTDILLSCYEKDLNTVGFAGISESILLKTLWSKRLVPVTLIGNDTTDRINGPVDKVSRRKLQIFMITTSSSKQLKPILEQIKRSRWWNHLATFLILDWQSSTKYVASNAFLFSRTAWQMNILKAVYVGFHPTKGLLIYSYNPYTSQAPEPWQLESTRTAKNGRPFAMFVREYGDGARICENLDFDKTIDLGGTGIYGFINAVVHGSSTSGFVPGVHELDLITARVLNATIFVGAKIWTNESVKFYDRTQIFMYVVDGTTDFIVQPEFYLIAENFTTTRVIADMGLVVLTQYSGFMSQLDKLIAVFDRRTRIGLCLVAVSIVIFFKCFRRETLSTAITNLFRLTSNSGLTNVPENQGARIYLTGVFILTVTILGVYQGIFASLLTNSKSLPNIKTMQDLVNSDHKIHVRSRDAAIFSGSEFKDRLIDNRSDRKCVEHVLRDSSVACIMYEDEVLDKTLAAKLHISKPIINLFFVFVIREDWPIEERFNMIRGTMIETGITRHFTYDLIDKKSREDDYYAMLAEDPPYRTIYLSDLTFIFAFLGISLGCAIVSFVVEIAFKRAPSKIRNVFGHVRSRLGIK